MLKENMTLMTDCPFDELCYLIDRQIMEYVLGQCTVLQFHDGSSTMLATLRNIWTCSGFSKPNIYIQSHPKIIFQRNINPYQVAAEATAEAPGPGLGRQRPVQGGGAGMVMKKAGMLIVCICLYFMNFDLVMKIPYSNIELWDAYKAMILMSKKYCVYHISHVCVCKYLDK